MKDFNTSEKVRIISIYYSNIIYLLLTQIHLLLLVGEAKVQSSLLYSMKAVALHFNNM